MRTIALLASILLITGCATYNAANNGQIASGTEYYNSLYQGQSHEQIVKDFGAPDREVSDGADGYILVYEKYYSTSRYDSMGYVDREVDKSYIQFFIDKQGICYNVMTNRLSPDQQKALAKTIGIGFGAISGLTTVGFIAILVAMITSL
ncbi:MAG: hypothetical protein J6X57_06270 [Bacteroidales bacterium]|nr:hypothetical protein [Bacteroidales bacterium]